MSDTKNTLVGLVTEEQWRQLEATLGDAIPPNCKRMVIDIGYPGQPCTVYWECFADAETIKLAFDVAISIGRAQWGKEGETDAIPSEPGV